MDNTGGWTFDGFGVDDAMLPSWLRADQLALSSGSDSTAHDFNWDHQEDFLLESFFNLETNEALWQTYTDVQANKEAPLAFVDPSKLQILDPPFPTQIQNNGPRIGIVAVSSQESVSESELTDSALPSPLTNLPTPETMSDAPLQCKMVHKADSIDAELWEERFSLIYSMHPTTTLTRMRKIFTEDHQFLASEKQWKKKIGQWQLEGRLPTKNIKKADMDWMLQIEHKYVHLDKQIKFRYRGFAVESEKLERHKKRFGFKPTEINSSKVPSYISCNALDSNYRQEGLELKPTTLLDLKSIFLRTSSGVQLPSQATDSRYSQNLPGSHFTGSTTSALREAKAELKLIYLDLKRVESRCHRITRVERQRYARESTPTTDIEWKRMSSLHETLLSKHHDLWVTSPRSDAGLVFKRLEAVDNLPTRLCDLVHSFLELLSQQLPESRDFMSSFLAVAFQRITAIHQSIPEFESIWLECLGDLARFHVAMKDECVRNRDIWAAVSAFWYCKASILQPNEGRLYHHIGSLATRGSLEQLVLYTMSLTSLRPDESVRESIQQFFSSSSIRRQRSNSRQVESRISSFLGAHRRLYSAMATAVATGKSPDEIAVDFCHFAAAPLRHCASWTRIQTYLAVINISAVLSYGSHHCHLYNLLSRRRSGISDRKFDTREDIRACLPETESHASQCHRLCCELFMADFASFIRARDENSLPFIHICLVFLLELSRSQRFFKVNNASDELLDMVPWADLCLFLNKLRDSEVTDVDSFESVWLDECFNHPLPEDYMTRGQVWGASYFLPRNCLENIAGHSEVSDPNKSSSINLRAERLLWLGVDFAKTGNLQLLQVLTEFPEEPMFESKPAMPSPISMTTLRVRRVLWLGYQLAKTSTQIAFDAGLNRWYTCEAPTASSIIVAIGSLSQVPDERKAPLRKKSPSIRKSRAQHNTGKLFWGVSGTILSSAGERNRT